MHNRDEIKRILQTAANGPCTEMKWSDVHALVGARDPQLTAFIEVVMLPAPDVEGATAGVIPYESLECAMEQLMWDYDDCADTPAAVPPMVDPLRTRMMVSMLESLGYCVRGKRHMFVQCPGQPPAHGWLYKKDHEGRIALPLEAVVQDAGRAKESDLPVGWDPAKGERIYYAPKWA